MVDVRTHAPQQQPEPPAVESTERQRLQRQLESEQIEAKRADRLNKFPVLQAGTLVTTEARGYAALRVVEDAGPATNWERTVKLEDCRHREAVKLKRNRLTPMPGATGNR